MPTARSQPRTIAARALCAVALVCALNACSSSEPTTRSDVVTIGLLLPFTGASSGTASNFERAAIFAEDQVTDIGGGIHGHPLRILSADTHSDAVRAQRSVEDLVNAGASVIVGPESAEVAAQIGPYLAAQHVTFLSPLIGAANNAEVDCSNPWFRLAPSAQDLGEALAKQIIAANVKSITLMYARTSYDEALRDSVSARFTALKGTVRLAVALDPNGQSYADEVNAARSANADAIVLASSPRAGALVVNEFDALSTTPPIWFLSPLLKTELLMENVAPDALEGARGVAPKIYDTSRDFPDAFAARWEGDQPLEGAYFYYDAVALLAFAMNSVAANPDGSYDPVVLNGALRDVAGPPGESVGWNELETGLARQRAGASIYFSGLTGPLVFRSCGDRAFGASSQWHVEAGSIITDAD